MNLEFEQILSQIVAFLIMVGILKRYAWLPLLEMIEERRLKIQNEFYKIEEQKKEVSRLLEDYQGKLKEIDHEAKQRLEATAERGFKIAQQIREDAYRQANYILHKAHEDAYKQAEKVKLQLKQQLVDLVVKVAQKVIQEKLDSQKDKQMIESFIQKLDVR
ncbi:F0F1 ATP synthase subunit B [Parachlamydia sp. AcF125]|uniref:F0F1 ATP synthase subunit B n=1 Tax=Parachlamydia sp. AcF125 TaxID=2795736 RepID=UPI001BC92D54|nr:F0F1 ATP synthase subunit B [Parachlamydia sp. AcF125]MBS4167489.1 ATP synthase subunit b [Parachlamydia sp. AcF125]